MLFRRATWSLLLALLVSALALPQQSRRIYIANDDHTDYVWAAGENAYRDAFLQMLDYYVNQADVTQNDPSDYQARFSTDGTYWLWTYQKNRSKAQFDKLMGRVKDGHITIPLQTLVLCYGAMSAEAVIRSMYYAGKIERQYGLRFELVSAVENQTLSYGLPSIWAGSGAKYSWKGVCGCATHIAGLERRPYELYRAVGPDGRSVLMKWHSLVGNAASGGYAEARNPAAAVDFATSDPTFLSRYPFRQVVGMFGKGWDDLQTLTTEFPATARAKSNTSQRVIVSNEVDFFHDLEETVSQDAIPELAAGYGNEWDLYPASLAEVTAQVKRSVESLRCGEALSVYASMINPGFMSTRVPSADSAFLNTGLYYEHDWTDDGPASGERPGFERRLSTQIAAYAQRLRTDALAAFSSNIPNPSGATRFIVFNPLGWTRTDVADLPVAAAKPVRVIDVTTGIEVRSQWISSGGLQYLRILADHVPSVGYRVYEVQPGQSAFTDTAGVPASDKLSMQNDKYRITVDGHGAITSLIAKRFNNMEMIRRIGGLSANDIGSGSGVPSVDQIGPVCTTLLVNAGGTPSHRARVTLYKDIDRIDIEDEILSNFSDNVTSYAFGFNLTGYTVRHEEVGAVATARPVSQGGSYADELGRYDYLTMNHFVDLSNNLLGVTLSNWDSPFFRLGNSTYTSIDGSSPQVRALVGGRIDAGLGIPNQNGDSYFRNRYALAVHGPYNQAAAMRMAIEHQNPLIASVLSSPKGAFPSDTYSFVTVSDSDAILWALKPSEEGGSAPSTGGLIFRLWNNRASALPVRVKFNGTIVGAWKTTHIETNISAATISNSAILDTLPGQWMQTYRVLLGTLQSIPFGKDATRPKGARLLPSYPNPFNPETVIVFEVAAGETVKVSICDVLGREVAVIHDGQIKAGRHEFRFNASKFRLSTGTYFCHLEAPDASETREIVLVK